MRILVVSIEYPPLGGGASPLIHEINAQFLRDGHSVTVITMWHNKLPLYEVKDGIEIYRIKCFRKHTHISYLWEHIAFVMAARKFLTTFIPDHPLDFCFTHFLVPSGIVAKWLYKTFRIPYILIAHGSDVPGYNPDRFYILHRFTPPLLRSIINSSSGIIAPSKYLQSLIRNIKGIAPQKVIHISSGIDTDYYAPGQKKPILLSTGRLLERKGFQYLIDAVKDEFFPFEVHICGDGPMMRELKAKAKNSLTPVIFHGWVDNRGEKYRSLLAEATIYCLVSGKENASTSLLEALSAGCAVITSDVSGCPESVGDAGICIPPANVLALKTQLRYLVDNPDRCAELMHQGRARAIDKFSWPTIAKKYLELTINNDQL